jgi:hypothetical protein
MQHYPIASHTVPAFAPDSRPVELSIHIGAPEPESPGERFRCLLDLGEAAAPEYALGASSLQALALAFTKFQRRLLVLESSGWTLRGSKGEKLSLELVRYLFFPDRTASMEGR